MKTISMIFVLLLMAGCSKSRTAEDRAKADAYCKKFGQAKVVSLTSGWSLFESVDFGCRVPGEITYTIVPHTVYE